MSLISDFVIAAPGSGDEIGRSAKPSDRWPTLQAKGVETVKLASLFRLITGQPSGSGIRPSFALAGGNEKDGPWVLEFPAEFLRSLAAVERSRIPSLASEWASTQELRADRWSPDDAQRFIAALADHAASATSSNSSLYLWLAL